MTDNLNSKLIDMPFIFLSKIYIRFYKGKNDLWIVFPTIILSLILTINIYGLINLIYDIEIFYIIGLYLILYFLLFYAYHKKFPDFTKIEKFKLNESEILVSLALLMSGLLSFIILLNIHKAN